MLRFGMFADVLIHKLKLHHIQGDLAKRRLGQKPSLSTQAQMSPAARVAIKATGTRTALDLVTSMAGQAGAEDVEEGKRNHDFRNRAFMPCLPFPGFDSLAGTSERTKRAAFNGSKASRLPVPLGCWAEQRRE